MLRTKLITTFAGVLLACASYAQTYSYSFSGNPTPEQLADIQEKCLTHEQISSCKTRLKPEKQVGELILYIEPIQGKGESQEHFKAGYIKLVLLDKGLTPLQFTPLTN